CSFTGGRVAPAQDSKGSLQEQSDKWFAVGVHQFVPILAILYLRKPCEHRPANASVLARRIEAGFEGKIVGTTSKFAQDRMNALSADGVPVLEEVKAPKVNDRAYRERQGPTRVVVIAGCLALLLFLCGIGLMAGLIAYHRGGMRAKDSSVAASPKESDRLLREPEKQEVQVQPQPAPPRPVEVRQDPVPSLPATPRPTAPRHTAKPATVKVLQDPIPPQLATPPAFSADDPKATLAWLMSISVEARNRTKNALADKAHREAMQQTMDQLNGRQVSWKATVSQVTAETVLLSPIKAHGGTLTLASLAENSRRAGCTRRGAR
ncbi:MAG TPA: hypothetical protein VMG10_34170, partial [Gemmataceae bacterium]|nr:hypothetical protein [Gemmataceae bacterium]